MAKPEFRTTIGRVKMKSNKPTKTKKAMKTMKNFLSMAALALMGAMMTGCSNDDNFDNPQQPETKNNVVTLTTTVSLDGGDATRALSNTGVKTFAVGETMAIYYWKDKGTVHEKAVSAPLTAGDITNGGKSATFTFTLDNPYKDMGVVYTYPAAMANADFTPNYDALYNNQDGTLATLASNFDFCTGSGTWAGGNLPSVTLENQLAILAITLKDNAATPAEITSSITSLTIGDGTNTYTVSRSAAAGPIYVAIRPVTSANIDITANDGSQCYNKSLTGKTYAADNGYSVSWKMPEALLSNANTANYGMVVCADGHLHLAKTAVPGGCTAVGILGKVTETGHGLILALQDAPKQTWDIINGWNSVTNYAGTTLKQLPDGARGSLTSYIILWPSISNPITVSNWCVAQKSDYEAIFTNLGSTTGDSNGTTYDGNVNAYITTGVGGTAMAGDYWSATEYAEYGGWYAWGFHSYSWVNYFTTGSDSVRPVLGF